MAFALSGHKFPMKNRTGYGPVLIAYVLSGQTDRFIIHYPEKVKALTQGNAL